MISGSSSWGGPTFLQDAVKGVENAVETDGGIGGVIAVFSFQGSLQS